MLSIKNAKIELVLAAFAFAEADTAYTAAFNRWRARHPEVDVPNVNEVPSFVEEVHPAMGRHHECERRMKEAAKALHKASGQPLDDEIVRPLPGEAA